MFWNMSNSFGAPVSKKIDRIIDDIFEPMQPLWKMTAAINHRNSVEETETSQIIHIPVAGHTASSVSVETDPSSRVLKVKADSKKAGNVHIAEDLDLSYLIPGYLDLNEVDATVKDGVLSIEIKAKKKSDGKTVQVKVK